MRTGIRVLTVFICVSVLAAPITAGPSAPKRGGTLVIGIDAAVSQLDVPYISDVASAKAARNTMYEGLVRVDFNGVPRPLLSEGWEQVDPTTWRFHLRKGVRFHNGMELTAEDVKFSFERHKKTPREPDVYQWYADSRIIDKYTIEVKTKSVFAPFLYQVGVGIVPKQYVEEKGLDYVKTHPVGTGPFKFAAWDKDNHLTLEAFNDYWQGRPYVDKVIFRPIVEGSARLAALLAGAVDVVDSVPPGDMESAKRDPSIDTVSVSALHHEEIILNHQKAPFDNLSVRRAIAHLVPRDTIVQTVYKGTRIPAYGPVTPAHKLFYRPQLKNQIPEYSVEKAKALLAEAGYPKGFDTVIKVDQDPTRVQVAEVVAQALRQAGINAKIEQFEWGTFVGLILSENSPKTLDIVVLWFSTGWDPNGLSFLYGWDNRTPACCNITHYRQPKLEDLFTQGRTTTDLQKRVQIYWDAQKIIAQELTWIFIDHQVITTLFRKTVKGLQAYPVPAYQFHLYEPDIGVIVWKE